MDLLQIEAYSFYRSVYPPVESDMYILLEGNEAIVVDSNISEEVGQLLSDNYINSVHLFLTHEHYDHSHGVGWLKEHFNCDPRLVAFVLSTKDMNDGGHRYELFKSEMTDYELKPDVYFSDGQILEIARHKIRIIHVPGHTPASSLLVMDEKIVFTGDSMIEGNKIITSFRGGNKDDMLYIAIPRLKQLPDDLMVLPGHGEPFRKEQFDFNIYNV